MFFYSEYGKVVNELLNNIDDWEIHEEFWIFHKYWIIHKSGIRLWIGNGSWSFTGDESKIHKSDSDIPVIYLGMIERHFLYIKAMKILKKQKLTKVSNKINNLKSFINNWKENETK